MAEYINFRDEILCLRKDLESLVKSINVINMKLSGIYIDINNLKKTIVKYDNKAICDKINYLDNLLNTYNLNSIKDDIERLFCRMRQVEDEVFY